MKTSVNTEKALSVRETEVLRLLSFGYSQKEIAEKLSISANTIDVHLKNIKEKTGLHKSTELTALWYLHHYRLPLFNIPARLRQIMAGAMLVLSLFSVIVGTDAIIRTRTQVTRTITARRGARRQSDYNLIAA